ncbi:MAG: hypothetical protein AAF387_10050 [Pseudomonadota bacterium]
MRFERGSGIAKVVIGMAACFCTTLQAMTFSTASNTVNVNYFFRNFPNPPIQDVNVYTSEQTSDTGALVQADIFRNIGTLARSSEGSATAELTSGTLKAFNKSTANIDDFVSSNDMIWVRSSSSANIGDSFVTTAPGSVPFSWNNGIGTFTIDIDGTLSKMATMDLPLNRGLASWSVGLIITNPVGETVQFGWRQSIGGFDSTPPPNNEPFDSSELSFVLASDPSICIVCEIDTSGFADLSGAVVGLQDQKLTARINIGSDFDWRLGLTARTEIMDLNDMVIADFANTATVSYQGPVGTTTSASVFSQITPSPIPLPAPLILLASGLAAVLRSRSKPR